MLGALENSGFHMAYASFSDALPDIRKSLRQSQKALILSNKGNEWLGTDSVGLSAEIEERTDSLLELQLVLLDENAPWLEEWSQIHGGKSLEARKAVFKASHDLIEAFFLEHKAKLSSGSGVHYHKETPCWRIIVTDDRLFISSYAAREPVNCTGVLSFKGPDTPFYNAAVRYFGFLRDHRSENRGLVGENLQWLNSVSGFKASAGLILQVDVDGDSFVLMLRRYDDTLTLPKGGIEPDESVRQAALREFRQETGVAPLPAWTPNPYGWFPNFVQEPDGRTQIKYVFYFRVRISSSTLPSLSVGAEHKAALWLKLGGAYHENFAYKHVEQIVQAIGEEI